jgi:hypothetical protein
MTTVKTPAQRGASNRRKGASAELAVAKWLRTVGFGGAERAVRTGYRTATRVSVDPGDLTGTPGITWSIKDCAVERLDEWLAELGRMAWDGAPCGPMLLVHKRRGHANPARWWCWMQLRDLMRLTAEGAPVDPAWHVMPVRMELGHVVPLLRAAGYGDRLEEAS